MKLKAPNHACRFIDPRWTTWECKQKCLWVLRRCMLWLLCMGQQQALSAIWYSCSIAGTMGQSGHLAARSHESGSGPASWCEQDAGSCPKRWSRVYQPGWQEQMSSLVLSCQDAAPIWPGLIGVHNIQAINQVSNQPGWLEQV